MEFYDPEVFNYYASMARGFQPQPHTYYQAPVQTTIDAQIDMEVQSWKTAFIHEEDAFVEDMMIKYPIEVERRKNALDQERSIESMQRAESCRRSRINNKIKKNKMRLRHQFASQKLKESSNLLNHINEVILDVETQLLRRGFPVDRLQYLREQFGMDRKAASPVLWQGYGYQ